MSPQDTTRMRVLSCAEVEVMLPQVVDGALDAADEPQVFEHLAGCEACQESLRLYDLIDLGLAGPREPVRTRGLLAHVTWPTSLAAGLLLTLGLAAAGWFVRNGFDGPHRSQDRRSPTAADTVIPVRAVAATPVPTPVVNPAGSPQGEIIQVIWPGPGRRLPVYIIRQGDKVLVMDQARLDGGQALSGSQTGTAMVAMPIE